MLSAAIYLLTNSLLLSLHLAGGAGSFPKPLSAAEERTYLERFAAGDIEARNVLIEHNLRLVAHVVKKYYTQEGEQDDLISIGTIGLIKGISSYKPEKNTRLATYAAKCIENAILTPSNCAAKTILDIAKISGTGGKWRLLFHLDIPSDRSAEAAGAVSANIMKQSRLAIRQATLLYAESDRSDFSSSAAGNHLHKRHHDRMILQSVLHLLGCPFQQGNLTPVDSARHLYNLTIWGAT